VSCSAGTLTVTPATSTSVGNGTLVQHDDSAAIQAAITGLASTGGSIFFPNGFYRCNGAFQDISHANAILLMPSISYVTNPPVSPVLIDLISDTAPSPGGTSGVVIQSSQTGGNLIGGYAADSGFGTFTNVWLKLKNLTFRSYDNPNIQMVNAGNLAGLTWENLIFDTGLPPLCGYVAGCTPTTPTHANAIAMTTPATNNNAGITGYGHTMVYGYYEGVRAQEHANIEDLYVTYANRCLPVASTNHPIYVARFACENASYGIYYVSGSPVIYIGQYSEEANTVNVAGANVLAGTINYSFPEGAVFTGASYLRLADLRSPATSGQIGNLLTGLPAVWYPGEFLNRPGLFVTAYINSSNQIILIPEASTLGFNFNGYTSDAVANFTGRSAALRVPGVVASTAGNVEYYLMGLDATHFIGFEESNGTLSFLVNSFTPVATASYNGTTQLYWRIRESAGRIYCEVAPDGSTWTEPTGFDSTVAWSYATGARLMVAAGTNNTSIASPGFATFDTFTIQ
jgi:hypothetical protein